MSLTIKAYLERSGSEPEIRRFPVPADVSSNYDYLFKKISEVFPGLVTGNFTLFWRDDENDLVRFSSDDELMSALSFRQGDVFKVFVHEHKEGSSGEKGEESGQQFHPNVTCDGCEGPIYGPRYKCYVCPDYDLCSRCESSGTHSEHEMLKIPAPKDSWMGFIPPPPHFRRWMNRFMRRWHNNHPWTGAGAPSGAPTETPAEAPEDKPAQGEPKPESAGSAGPDAQGDNDADVAAQYLQDVGESVAAMLDPLGIDVSVDVETPGGRPKGGHRMRGHGPWGRGPWGCGPWGPPPPFPGGPPAWGPGGPPAWGPGGPCGTMPQGPGPWGGRGCGMRGGRGGQCKKGQGAKCGGKKQAPQQAPATETPMETEIQKEASTPSAPQAAPAEIIADAVAQSLTDFIVDTNGTVQAPAREPSPSSEWTVVYPSLPGQDMHTDTQTDTQTDGAPQPPAPVEEPLPADPKVARALQQMMEMGFSNEGGWLTRLVEMKQGDISQCLDAIKPMRNVEPTGERRV